MNNKYLNIIVVLLSVFTSNTYSQINCTVPEPPVLTSVSVQPETGKTEFTWILSESPDIAGYILYSYNNGDGQAIDTIWEPAATSHTISNTAPKYSSVSYVIAAHRLSSVPGMPGCTSPFSNVLSTIFCETDIDTCYKEINIRWNRYPSEPIDVTGYSVLMSINGGLYSEVAATGVDTSYTLNNFTTGASYCFYIMAVLEGGKYSTSNKACVLTKMQRPPDWINADYATVNPDNKISLSFSVDPLSEVYDFILDRKTGADGTFVQITHLESSNGSVLFTDQLADENAVNFYRLSAINSCGNPITLSNIASNMVLALKKQENELNLSWNPYREWNGMVSEYILFVNTGNGFEENAVIEAKDSSYILDYKEIMYNVTGNKICLYISAVETANPYGITGESKSSGVCTEPLEVITVPNIFTPNNDLANDQFRPVLSFTPKAYHLIISEQHGSVIFETRDWNESWDGSNNGKLQPDGVYLWFLQALAPSGKSMSRTGIVTILKNP
jgi:gliding motility-associated-like protein